MVLKGRTTLTLVAASILCLALSAQAQPNGQGKGQGPGHGNAHGHSHPEALSIPIATAPGSPVTGTGTFHLQRFVDDGGVVKAVGIVTGTFTDGTQSVSILRNVSVPVTFGQGAAPAAAELNDAFESGPSDGRNAAEMQVCQILNLVLGPLDLNILGLRVELNRVVLDITGDPAGGLLGALLCAIAGLLSGPAGPLVTLLNQLLGALL